MLLTLQEFQPKDFGGLVTKNHLGSIFGAQTQEASKFITMINQVNYAGSSLDAFLNKYPVKTLDTTDDIVWKLQGSNQKNLPLVECRINGTAITATSKPGFGFSEFELVFPESLFSATNIIMGEKQNAYLVRIVENPTLEGMNYVYRCVLMTPDANMFMPYDYLIAGKRFGRSHGAVEQTLSKRGSGINFTSPYRMRNVWTMFRKQDTMPGDMIRRPMGVTYKDPTTGKEISVWMEYRDWEFDRQFQYEKNNLLYWGTINRTAQGTYMQKGDSGYEVQTGAGLRQQIEQSNNFFYPYNANSSTNGFDVDWLTDILLGLSVNKLPQDRREFMLRSGEYGMVQWSRALELKASLYTPLFDKDRLYQLGKNGIGFKGQYLEYMGPNGIKVTIAHEPMKDDINLNILKHPKTGAPAESYTYDILDIGTVDNEPNIQKYTVKNGDILAFEAGIISPFDIKSNGYNVASNPTHGYTIHRAFTGAVIVKNPARCAIVRPSFMA